MKKSLLRVFMTIVSVVTALSSMSMTVFAEGEQEVSTASAGGSLGGMLLSMGLVLLVMYFLFMRPQKKKEKETKAMQDNVQIGDEIVTYGGMVGIVVRKGEDNVVIETGGEKNKIRIKTWAISENTTAKEKAAAEEKAAQKAKLTPAKGNEKSDEKPEKKTKLETAKEKDEYGEKSEKSEKKK